MLERLLKAFDDFTAKVTTARQKWGEADHAKAAEKLAEQILPDITAALTAAQPKIDVALAVLGVPKEQTELVIKLALRLLAGLPVQPASEPTSPAAVEIPVAAAPTA